MSHFIEMYVWVYFYNIFNFVVDLFFSSRLALSRLLPNFGVQNARCRGIKIMPKHKDKKTQRTTYDNHGLYLVFLFFLVCTAFFCRVAWKLILYIPLNLYVFTWNCHFIKSFFFICVLGISIYRNLMYLYLVFFTWHFHFI